MICVALQLFGYWSHDIGGFHNGTTIPHFAKGYPYEVLAHCVISLACILMT